MILPLVLLLAALFLIPLAIVVTRSFSYPDGAGVSNYLRVLSDPIALQHLGNTFRTAATVTVVTVVLGYGYGYAMHKATPGWSLVLMYCALLPFWTSLLVRSFAWTVLLRDSGVINQFLIGLGLIETPLPLLRNSFAVTLGMTQILLPFVILPAWAAMNRIEPDLVRAARSLGAGPVRTFWRVFFPLSVPGLAAGALLTFILAVGYYITPVLLGGAKDQPVAVLIESAVRDRGDWGLAGALSTLVTAAVVLLLAIGWRALSRVLLSSKEPA